MISYVFRFKRSLLSLIMLGAAAFVISGCIPRVPVESLTISTVDNVSSINTIEGSLQFSAVILPEDATDKTVFWSVIDGSGSATIDAEGVLTALTDGTVTVKAVSNDDTSIFATKIITISNQYILPNSISVSSEDNIAFIDVYHGSLQMHALVLPENAMYKNVTWSVENGTGSASITTTGLLTAITNGTVIVKATSAELFTVYGTKTIALTNQDASVTSVVISSAGEVTEITTFQGTLQLSAVVLPTETPNNNVIWSVVNFTGSATINASGLLTAVSNGTVTVHATSESNPAVNDTLLITITNQEVNVTSIVLTSAGNAEVITVFHGTLQFSADVLPANATDKDIVWSVVNGSGNATISTTGLLSAVSNGTVTVVVTSVSNSHVDASKLVTISNQEIVVTSITVDGEESKDFIDLLEGTLQMEALVLPENAVDKSVTWSVVNDTGSASISSSGLLTALTNGLVTVKATASSNDLVYGMKVITITNQEEMEPAVLAVDLKTAADYVILSKSGLSTASTSAITGDIGVSPSPASYITGFSLIMDASNEFSFSSQVTGKVYASDYSGSTPVALTAAIGDMEAAYTDAAGRAPSFTELYAGDLSGQTLTTGVYKFGTNVLINSNITLTGSATDVIIIQVSGSLIQAAGTQVILAGGLLEQNIFWQVAGSVSIGTNAHFEGTILSMTSIALETGASVNGRLYAQTAITLDGNQIN